MPAAADPDPQTTLYETVIDNPDVEAALEKREKLKQRSKALAKDYRQADAAAKEALNQLDLGADAPVRIGRFVVSMRQLEGRVVSFETGPSTRLNIKPLEEAA